MTHGDRELELYDIFAAADYEADIMQTDANCCAILSRIQELHDGQLEWVRGQSEDGPLCRRFKSSSNKWRSTQCNSSSKCLRSSYASSYGLELLRKRVLDKSDLA